MLKGGEMNLTLEDMTKEELIKVIKQSLAYQPTLKTLLWIRWESMCEQTQALMKEALKEHELYTGKKDMVSHSRWMDASKKFDKGMKLGDKADAFLEEIKGK